MRRREHVRSHDHRNGARALREPLARDAADVDDDGSIEIDDALAILEYLFRLGQAPPPPFPQPGRDPSEDDLDCEG